MTAENRNQFFDNYALIANLNEMNEHVIEERVSCWPNNRHFEVYLEIEVGCLRCEGFKNRDN